MINNLNDKLLLKLMCSLSPTKHELDCDTIAEFKEIIIKNIDEDTSTIKKLLKEYWINKNTFDTAQIRWLFDD